MKLYVWRNATDQCSPKSGYAVSLLRPGIS